LPDPWVEINLRLQPHLIFEKGRLDKSNIDGYIYAYNIAEGENSPANRAKRFVGNGFGARNGLYTKTKVSVYAPLVQAADIEALPAPRNIRRMNIADPFILQKGTDHEAC
jgi:hypothetical protein